MIKVDIFSGFLGAGKTTLIKKLIAEAYNGEKVVLIENEFGEIGIDGNLFEGSNINITEINSGCICCSLAGDFTAAFGNIVERFEPDRILIEPSGVGKLSDIASAVQSFDHDGIVINSLTTIVDAKKCRMYVKNFGEFFANQIEYANAVILSHTNDLSATKISECIEIIKGINTEAAIITTDWDKLGGSQILETIECRETLEKQIQDMLKEHKEHEHHHHGDEDEHEHHHHHGAHGHQCSCGHDHEHDADEIFDSWGIETAEKYSEKELMDILHEIEDEKTYGMVIRAKGIVESPEGSFIHFDYVPGEPSTEKGAAAVIGRICVIGASINVEKIEKLFSKEK